MEESVFRHLNHKERSGYRAEYDEYHSLSDPIYELPEDDREEAFAKINKLFFVERLKLGDHVFRALEAVGLIPKRKRTARRSRLNALQEAGNVKGELEEELEAGAGNQAESEQSEDQAVMEKSADSEAVSENTEVALAENEPEGDESDKEDEVSYDLARQFEERLAGVTVKRAINKVDEGSNVLARHSGRPVIEMRVLASRFSNPEEAQELDAFLIHEFMHAKDMVDPEFDYEDSFIPGNPSVKNLITARFRLLWNIYVDSRLGKMGVISVMTREGRYREFDNFYRKIPDRQVTSSPDRNIRWRLLQ